jgi:hypothetical protein
MPTKRRLFAFVMPSSVIQWVIYYMENSLFLINASLCASLVFTNNLASTVHLHATYGVLVIAVDKLIYSLVYLIKRALFLCVHINVGFTTLERAMTCVLSLEN